MIGSDLNGHEWIILQKDFKQKDQGVGERRIIQYSSILLL